METPDHGNDALAPVGHISQPACHAQADLGAAIDVQRTAAFHVHYLGLSRCRRTGLPAGAHIARPPCSQVGGRWTASLPATAGNAWRTWVVPRRFSADRLFHERGDPCLGGGGQLRQREGDRPQGAASLKPNVAYLV